MWPPGTNPSNHTNQLHHTDKTTTQQTPNTTTGQNAYPGHHKQRHKRNQNQTCCPPNKIVSFLLSTSQVLGTPPLHMMGNLNTELETKSKLTHEKPLGPYPPAPQKHTDYLAYPNSSLHPTNLFLNFLYKGLPTVIKNLDEDTFITISCFRELK